MIYQPTDLEIQCIPKMTRSERMEYFLARATESEELWSIGSSEGWWINEENGKKYVTVWNYKPLVGFGTAVIMPGYFESSVSLEKFVDELLPIMTAQDIYVEVFPTASDRGVMLPASSLFEIFDRKLDSETYFVEG